MVKQENRRVYCGKERKTSRYIQEQIKIILYRNKMYLNCKGYKG